MHSSKQESQIVFTVEGMTIFFNVVHSLNNLFGIAVKPPSNVTFTCPWKALSPTDFTEVGIDISVNDVQPSKQESPIVSTVCGMETFFNVVQSLNKPLEIVFAFPDMAIVWTPSNAFLPTCVIGVVNEISAKDVQPVKDESPISVTNCDSTTSVNDSQSLNISFGNDVIWPERTSDLTPSNALYPTVLIVFGIYISFSELHLPNDDAPIASTGDENTIFVSDVQFLNALSGTDDISPMIVNSLILMNAFCFIVITDNEIDNSAKFVQPSKADFPMILNDLEITTLFRVVQFLNESLRIFSALPDTVNSVHPVNESFPMEASEGGIDISFNAGHPLKAQKPIETTDCGIVILGKAAQFSKALLPIFDAPCSIVTSVNLLHPLNNEFSMCTTEKGTVT